MGPIRRRHFILAAAGMAGAWAFYRGSRLLPAARYASLPSASFKRTSHALGTKVAIKVLHESETVAEKALSAAFDAIAEVESQLSIYRPDSQVSLLNQQKELASPHADLLAVLKAAQETSVQSQGAFDITVQPLWELFATAQKEGRLPTESAIADARQKVNWKHVKTNASGIRLAGRDTKITLNGIAQGYAADRALAALKDHGIEHALVDAGELAAKGAGSQKPGWQIGVQHPRHEDAYIALAMLQDRCFSTTGDYATTFGRDYRFHHVFDPQTGVSPQEVSSVSVAAPTAMQADAWSTAAFVMGPEKACEVLRTLPGHDALFVLKDGRMLTTPGFPLFDEGSAS